MNMLVLGGDARSGYLAMEAKTRGWQVGTRYLDGFALPLPQDGVHGGWDVVVLPYPVCQKEGVLCAPLFDRPVPMYEALEGLSENRLIVGGIGAKLWTLGACNPGEDEGFVIDNAAITAEGAIYCAMRDGGKGIMGTRCLILGGGRIARFLAVKLHALGAEVTLAARKQRDRAFAHASGWSAVGFDECELSKALSQADFVFNTVPYPVLKPALLEALSPQAYLYELASAPYGFSLAEAHHKGVKAKLESGLPGRYAPQAAACAMLDVIERLLKEAPSHA